ncbi:ABC transporter permease [Photobacterium iliopiscarium]|jgi:ABC-2 type transport system permease protein|uniref:Transport permease protein n=1 Tax=Photobacterium iliopiscarium TaxID=56192 RepID=A0A0D8P1M0_9GAMM|nr:ABC transporter permease [Photobacterium iliopiscarium]KJG12688.1 ABC transporter permease [Photobacterium iliopiscarium]KJG21721.1 ABC transporter permease [Photobacterium iliopiscarium]MCD9486115.1 ABC transporter permease [Photobacterium iliopiscarium]MCF2242700.1 ABC transporter permease [Photobacterium iliopiscarium]PST93784.1 ABC transporter permease [Photobacterium iliopiscarium]
MKKQYWIAFKSLISKEIHRFTRIWVQTLVPPAITMTLYFIIFGNLIGKRIGDMEGFSYMEYIVPGLIMMSVITNSYSNVASSFFSAKFQHNIEELLVAPVPNYIIIAGYVGGGVLRGLSVGLIVSVVSLLFVSLNIAHLWVIIATVVMTSIVFSLGGLINAIFARTFDDISIIPTFVLTPLTYLGGVFYSINLLPEVWQIVSKVNPIVYMVNAFRYGFLGVSDVGIGTSFTVLTLFVIALYGVAYYLISRGIGLRS